MQPLTWKMRRTGNGQAENGSTQVRQKHVLILGGTGRVGSSTAAALLRSEPGLRITLAGRSRKTYEAAMKRRPELACCEVTPTTCLLHKRSGILLIGLAKTR